jgi:hypothetical protein
MEKYLLERIYEREGDLPTSFMIYTLEKWNKYNKKWGVIDYDCYIKIGNLLYKPIKLNNK